MRIRRKKRCPFCRGKGQIRRFGVLGNYDFSTCSPCGGTGDKAEIFRRLNRAFASLDVDAEAVEGEDVFHDSEWQHE